MIIHEIFYAIKCNRCGEVHSDGEHEFWNDESIAIENAYESDWAEHNGKHYCENCHEINEDTDEVVVFEEYPSHLNVLIKFIDSIIRGYHREIFEYNEHFEVKCTLRDGQLAPFDRNYLENRLSDLLISIDLIPSNHISSNKLSVLIKK